MNRQNLMILIVDLVLIIIFIGGFGWGIGTVKRYQVEPNTSRTETNTDSLYSESRFEKTLKKFKRLDLMVRLGPVKDAKTFNYTPDEFNVKYSSQPIVPGLKATKTLNAETGEVEVCTTMTPQGVTVAGDYLLTTAYDHDGFHNSVMYIQNLKTGKLLNTVVLNGRPHVGGLTYDAKNDNIWICGRRNNAAEVFAIKLKTALTYNVDKKAKAVAYSQRAQLGNISRASFVTYYENALFVGFFNPTGKGNIQRYPLNDKGQVVGKSLTSSISNQFDVLTQSVLHQDILSKIQGMAFYGDYTILSQSYGGGNSTLYIFKTDPKKTIFRASDAIDTFDMPSHLEQISTHDGRMYMMFESAAYAYRHRSTNQLDRVLSMNLEGFVQLVLKEEK
ncbi:hypothetical protein [Lacticaseibacillus paracasei]|uniref:hypothetical protein n=1 Tax=Lacticaseibacillus paracasei TaxID=1597 RepID=UPI0018928D9B|nr:hypothetical protein [Lacticaseibacillus paracasei]QPC18601.1 hypothetical protein LacP0734_13310 [Lacticaseibacillus paracasei subsp. tolerans]QPI87557.1 hypothetical protein I3F57_11625 [Lacticaseibacillus paracasei subsp. tolerans]QXJ67206.1 hypothetical protein J5Y16_09800 [Lacticaseibacillus paracasei subsp. paracasei]